MPRKRKAAAGGAGAAKKAKGGDESGSSSFPLIDRGEIGARYLDPEADSPSVGIDGIILLAEDLEIEVEDPAFLVLAWEMRAETQGVFKRSEWLDGFQRIFKGTKDFVLRVDDLKKRLPKLRAKLSRMDDLESIWNWSFDFCKEDEVKKFIKQEDALPIMDMLLKDHFTLWGSFNKFLRMDDKRLITKDQWKMTLKFLIFSGGDIGKYDPMDAWPVLLDEWIEWIEKVGHEAAGIVASKPGAATATVVDLTT